MAEVARPVRFLNVADGRLDRRLAVPARRRDDQRHGRRRCVGLALIGLSLPRGERSAEHYGGWDQAIV